MDNKTEKLSDDLLTGAAAIADYLFGNKVERRRVYGLSPEEQKALGIFRIGKILYARRATIDRRVAEREMEAS
jgi:hypothetical protein